jgi:hypothetical protein
MDLHRRAVASHILPFLSDQPFSCFDWAEANHFSTESIRRCFSLARSLGMRSFIVEDIPAEGIIHAENQELNALVPDHTMPELKRLSFWTEPIADVTAVASTNPAALCGYAIVKHDRVPSRNRDRWHVFEAVFRKYPHEHNCVPTQGNYRLRVSDTEFTIPGILYAQQNGLNKVCAHVALRTLLSRQVPAGDLSYAEINRLAAKAAPGPYDPAAGLGPPHIRAILRHFKLAFRDIDYAEEENISKDIRLTHPFQKFIYAGIESGCGALLGFRMTGPSASCEKHIIPFFGHTFNKDTWVPDADRAYFDVGGGVGYIPSESWTSSFLGHDDNFGPNLCVPRLYVKPDQAEYVVELLRDGVAYSGVHAEAITLIFLYSLWPHMAKSHNPWMKRLAAAAHPDLRRVVLRAVCVSKDAYLQHVRAEADWDGNRENPDFVAILDQFLPQMLWVVEISLPHIFPANEHKLGEILLHPFVPFDPKAPINYALFLLARLPGRCFVLKSSAGASPSFMEAPSACTSHRALLKL